MSTYLLLRDNKQSGPYSLSEIQTKGFKKYDLVWVEGKSAAWRYPGEITELKPFAPIVEEQPFDRFFKKPSELNKETNTLRQEPLKKEIEKTAVAVKQVVVEIGDKKVYAALPAKRNSGNPQPQVVLIKPSSPIKEEIKKTAPDPIVNNYYQEKEPEAAHEQSIYQSKEKYFSKKSENNYRKYFQPIALAACIVALLGAGIFIGMSINKNSPTNTSNVANEKQVAKIDNPEPQNVSIPISTTVPTEEKAVATNKENANLNNGVNAVPTSKTNDEEKTNTLASDKKKASRPKASDVVDLPKIIPQHEAILDSSSSSGLVTRQSTHRTDAINDKELVKNSLANLVSLSANKYNVGAFGGISEVQLTLNNKSTYPLDLVMVEVQYIQSNKKIYKTENLYYRNVLPGEAMMQEAPKSSRGVKIQYKVTLINSKESSVSYSRI